MLQRWLGVSSPGTQTVELKVREMEISPPTQGHGCGPHNMKQQQCLFKTQE